MTWHTVLLLLLAAWLCYAFGRLVKVRRELRQLEAIQAREETR